MDNFENGILRKAERYAKKYAPQVNLLESASILSKVRQIRPYDIYALGSQLESFDTYKAMCEADGNIGNLGRVPDIALDVLSVVYGTSIMPLIASVQPIDEQNGLVYFKSVKAEDTRGNMTAGDLARDPRVIGKTPQNYASNQINSEQLGTVASAVTAGTTQTVTGTLVVPPVTPQTVRITIGEPASVVAFGMDDGNGVIVGSGVSGTVNYTTGAVSLSVSAVCESGTKVYVNYRTNFEIADDIPQMQSYYGTHQVQAKVFALKSTLGMLQNYAMQKRFGIVAEDEIARDLIGEINAEIGADLIRLAHNNAAAIDDWNQSWSAGESWFLHKQSLSDHLALLDQKIAASAGRGEANFYIVGSMAASIFQTLPGFTKISDGTAFGPSVFGTINGKTIIRVPEQAVLDANEVIGIWKGVSPFESALVYAPYMPLVLTDTLPNGVNPLRGQRAAAVWSACDSIVPAFMAKFKITGTRTVTG